MVIWSIFGGPVDAEGEVLDVLVQSKRNKQAMLKSMRKLLRKYAFDVDDLANPPFVHLRCGT